MNQNLALLFTTSALMLSTQLAVAAPFKPLPPFRGMNNDPTPAITYHGGPVIGNVRVVGVYWGPNVDANVQTRIPGFYKAIVDSTYVDILSEYQTNIKSVDDGSEGTHQQVGRGTFAGMTTIIPQNGNPTITQADVEKELEYQIEAKMISAPESVDLPNTLYMIHFPKSVSISISFGASCVQWGADHEVYHSLKYGRVYYAMMPDCGYSFEKTTEAASHEFAEAITDPNSPLAGKPNVYPAGWITTDGSEIGDVCAWQPATLTAGSEQYTVQKEWQVSKLACSSENFVSTAH